MTEFDLVKNLFRLAKMRAEFDAELTKATEEYVETEAKLIEALTAQEKTATATYESFGYVSLVKPAVRASYEKENEEKVFEFLREQSREDLIKTQVNAASLSGFVREQLDEGRGVPEFIKYYLQPRAWIYTEQGKRFKTGA